MDDLLEQLHVAVNKQHKALTDLTDSLEEINRLTLEAGAEMEKMKQAYEQKH